MQRSRDTRFADGEKTARALARLVNRSSISTLFADIASVAADQSITHHVATPNKVKCHAH
jgi:hypothetical protein